jgi:hypothetical protein
MAISQRDLWPEIITLDSNLNPPIKILREQADFLKDKTQGIVLAEVRTLSDGEAWMEASMSGLVKGVHAQAIGHSFFLVAPNLGNYKYLLFRVIQPVEMYPLVIADSPLGEGIKVDTEEGFSEKLSQIFASEKTQKVIQSLVSQSRSQ